MSDQVADPAGGEDGGFTPETDPAISPGGYIPPSSGADVAPPGLLTAPEPAAPAAAVPQVASATETASFALPEAVASSPLPGDVPSPPPPNAARPARRAGRVIALAALIVVGVAGIGAGGTFLTRELTRGPTSAEKAAAIQQEIASRWRRYPAGKIFTPTIGYSTSDFGANFNATLVGIAEPVSCSAALDPGVANPLVKDGCVTVLRATYLDPSGTEATTVGVLVMKSTSAADLAIADANSLPPSAGVRTFPLSGTLADQFGDAQRQFFSSLSNIGPYVFMSVAGYTDGRVVDSAATSPDSLSDLGNGVIVSMQSVLSYHVNACAMKDIRC